jgi:hypothetical protein
VSTETRMNTKHASVQRTARAALRDELSERLLPEVRRLGFEGPARIVGNALAHEFSRRAGDERHVLTLQLEKRGLPRFVIRVCVEPPQGLEALTAQGGTLVSAFVRAKPGGSTRSWFRADPSWRERLFGRGGSRHVEAVNRCLELLPEIEAWWTHRKASAHIATYDVVFPGTSKRTDV